MLTETDVQDIVRREIDAVLFNDADTEYSLADPLLATGLNSLMLAQLLIQLETALGVDPFGAERSIVDTRTVGDLVAAYAQALAATVGEVHGVG